MVLFPYFVMGKYAEVQRYETREIQQYKHF